MNKMRAPPQKPSLTIATLIVAICIIPGVDIVGAEVAAAQKTWPNIFATSTCAEEEHAFSSTSTATLKDDAANSNNINDNGEYIANCYIWPPAGAPPEHFDHACDRARQNALWAAEDAAAKAAPPGVLISDTVYLNMPEEKTWACPLDTVDETPGSHAKNLVKNGGNDKKGGATGHPTRWILHNEATTPIVLAHVNPLGLEVSAMDFRTHPAHANTAVYPNGPIVLPGQLAVVEGRQGQMFVVREYKEMLPMHAMAGNDGDGHSWNSFKSVLPSTMSFSRERTRYETNKGVQHVLGNPGRVLMKHRMGNIYVKNQFGAICPKLLGVDGDDVDNGRTGSLKDMNPDCNVLRKALINKVGCPVDIYFAPQNKIEGYNCEKFSSHLGSLDSFLASEREVRDIDGFNSPLKFENSYNSHTFVARMSHDKSLVARIELDHDIVRDCPEPGRNGPAGVKVQVDERMLQGLPIDIMSINTTKSVHASNEWLVIAQVNTTAAPITEGKLPKEKHNLLWHNRTSTISASVPIVS